MNYPINLSSRQPAYLQLYQYLKKDIINGVYLRKSRLPSKRMIAEETGVSVITAEHALLLLCEEGYAEARPRSGYYVIYRADDFRDSAAESISESAGEVRTGTLHLHHTGDFPYSVLARTMRRVLLDYSEQILVKSPNLGCPQLRSEICAYLLRSRGISVSPARVVIGSGAEYLYGLIAQLLGRERTFALEKPSYDKIRRVYESMGICCELLKLGADGILSSELSRTSASVLHVTPFNSFPSGITAGISKKLEYLRWAKGRAGYVIEDNFDSELTVSRKPEEPLFKMTEDDNVIYINTFSKTIAPSIRTGYMLLPVHLAEAFEARLGFYSCTVPAFEQYVLTELLKSGDFERHVNRQRRKRRLDMQKMRLD